MSKKPNETGYIMQTALLWHDSCYILTASGDGAGKTKGKKMKGKKMKVTKKSVIIETTNTVHGMLEQGGVSGRIMAYPLEQALSATGLKESELKAAKDDDRARGYWHPVTVREAIERECAGRCIRRGSVIQ